MVGYCVEWRGPVRKNYQTGHIDFNFHKRSGWPDRVRKSRSQRTRSIMWADFIKLHGSEALSVFSKPTVYWANPAKQKPLNGQRSYKQPHPSSQTRRAERP